MTAHEKVAMALHAAEADCLERGEVMGYTVLADAAIAAHLEALKADGYVVVKLQDVTGINFTHEDGTPYTPDDLRYFAGEALAAAAKADADE